MVGIHLMVGEGKPLPYNPFGQQRRGGFYTRPQTHVAVLNKIGVGKFPPGGDKPRPYTICGGDNNVGAAVYPRPKTQRVSKQMKRKKNSR